MTNRLLEGTEKGTTLSEKITAEEVQDLIARMAILPEPNAQQLVALARRFSPEDLAHRMNQRLNPMRVRKPKRPSTSARMKLAIKATKEAGMEAYRVEIDADGKVTIVTGKSTEEPATEFDKWKAKRNARSA